MVGECEKQHFPSQLLSEGFVSHFLFLRYVQDGEQTERTDIWNNMEENEFFLLPVYFYRSSMEKKPWIVKVSVLMVSELTVLFVGLN